MNECIVAQFFLTHCVYCRVQTSAEDVSSDTDSQEPISHWQSRLTINTVSERVSFDRRSIPGEIYRYIL